MPCHCPVIHFFRYYRHLPLDLCSTLNFSAGGPYRGAKHIPRAAIYVPGALDGVLLSADDQLRGGGH